VAGEVPDGEGVPPAVTRTVLVVGPVFVVDRLPDELLEGAGVVDEPDGDVDEETGPLMANGSEYWNVLGVESRLSLRPYAADVPRVPATAQSYLPAALSIPEAIEGLTNARCPGSAPASSVRVRVPLYCVLCAHVTVYVVPALMVSPFPGLEKTSKPAVWAETDATRARRVEIATSFIFTVS